MSETMTFRMTNPGRLAISVALLGVGFYLGFLMKHKGNGGICLPKTKHIIIVL